MTDNTITTIIAAAITLWAVTMTVVAAWRSNRAANLTVARDLYRLETVELRRQLDDAERRLEQYRISNSRMALESVVMVAEVEHYKAKYSWLGARRYAPLRKRVDGRRAWRVAVIKGVTA